VGLCWPYLAPLNRVLVLSLSSELTKSAADELGAVNEHMLEVKSRWLKVKFGT